MGRPASYVHDLEHPTTQLFVDLHRGEQYVVRNFVQKVQEMSSMARDHELDVLLTASDVAETRVPATLCIFSSQPGLHPLARNANYPQSYKRSAAAGVSSNVVAYLDYTTKKRSSYYLRFPGDGNIKKGVRYTSTSAGRLSNLFYVLSDGCCIQFEVASGLNGQGCIMPKWRIPTKVVQLNLRRRLQLQALPSPRLKYTPKTIIIVPLRQACQVQTVQRELTSFYHHRYPQPLLSPSNLSTLELRDHVSYSNTPATLTTDQVPGSSLSPKALTINHHGHPRVQQLKLLQIWGKSNAGISSATYKIFQLTFAATIQRQQPRGSDSEESNKCWMIELIFPGEGSNLDLQTGSDLYALNSPSQCRPGFPFLINGNFVLAKDGTDDDGHDKRGLLDLDIPWNKGILGCIPRAFQVAFEGLLAFGGTDVERILDAYKAIPVRIVDELEEVRRKILENLNNSDVVMISSKMGHAVSPQEGIYFSKPNMSRLVASSFLEMLELAHDQQGLHAPSLQTSSFFVVDGETQRSSLLALETLGVPRMRGPEYVKILGDTSFLMRLSEEAYVKLLEFLVALNPAASFTAGPLDAIPLVKYRRKDGALAIASPSQTKEMTIFLSSGSSNQEEILWLSQWTALFEHWAPSYFIPNEIVKIIVQSKRQDAILDWLRRIAKILDLTVENYARKLMDMLSNAVNSEITILVSQFLFIAIQAKYLQRGAVLEYLNALPCCSVVDKDGRVFQSPFSMSPGTLLLPRSHSKWGTLLDGKEAELFATEISAEYFKSGSLSSELTSMKNFLPVEENVQQFSDFLHDAFGVVDAPELIPTLDDVHPFTHRDLPFIEDTLVHGDLNDLQEDLVHGDLNDLQEDLDQFGVVVDKMLKLQEVAMLLQNI